MSWFHIQYESNLRKNDKKDGVKALAVYCLIMCSAFFQGWLYTTNTVATYEMGRSIPSDAAVALICKQFEVNEDWLRNGEGEMFVKKSKDEQISEMLDEIQRNGKDSFKRRLVTALANLNESDWEVLEKLIDSIGKE